MSAYYGPAVPTHAHRPTGRLSCRGRKERTIVRWACSLATVDCAPGPREATPNPARERDRFAEIPCLDGPSRSPLPFDHEEIDPDEH